MGALPAILPFFVSQYAMDYRSVAGLMFASCFLSSVVQPEFGWLRIGNRRHGICHWELVRKIGLINTVAKSNE